MHDPPSFVGDDDDRISWGNGHDAMAFPQIRERPLAKLLEHSTGSRPCLWVGPDASTIHSPMDVDLLGYGDHLVSNGVVLYSTSASCFSSDLILYRFTLLLKYNTFRLWSSCWS